VDGLRRMGQPSASVGRPWRTAPAAGGRPPLPAVGGRSTPSVRRLRWPTALPSAGGRPPRRTSVGSLDASGCPADTAVDVRTRDNPDQKASPTNLPQSGRWCYESSELRLCFSALPQMEKILVIWGSARSSGWASALR
jgi:hypothetical protein